MLLNLLEKTVDACFALIPRTKPSVVKLQSILLIAHRGAHNHARGIMENTLAAFDLAQELGCWGIELDVRETADKVLVVNHDATLKRLWGHDQLITNLSFKELRNLVPAIPTLKEVVAAYGKRLHLFIELKTPLQNDADLALALEGLTPVEHYYLLTLNAEIFSSLPQFSKNALLLVASHNNVGDFCNMSLKENYGGVLAHYFLMNNKEISRLKSAEQIVGVGMINSQYSLYRELNRGINWLFTDKAEQMAAYLNHF